jgi:hypothetical protein
MNDFNLGSILEWNDRDQKYCPRMREAWCYEVRAPEEMFGIPFDEKIDVFSFGNAIYAMVSTCCCGGGSAAVTTFVVIPKCHVHGMPQFGKHHAYSTSSHDCL